jgi:hypothetical protein
MLYDENGDGVAGRNLAYADGDAAPEDGEEAAVYAAYTVPAAASETNAEGRKFLGYRVEAQGTEYAVETKATYWKSSTVQKSASALGFDDADDAGYSRKAAAAGLSVAAPASHKYAPTGEAAPNVLVSKDGGKTYTALNTPAYVSPGDKVMPVSVIASGEYGDVYPYDGRDFELPVWELELTPVYEVEDENAGVGEEPGDDTGDDLTPPSPETPGGEDEDGGGSATGDWLALIEKYAKSNWDPTGWAVSEVEFDGKNRLTHFVMMKGEYTESGFVAEYTVEYQDGQYICYKPDRNGKVISTTGVKREDE